MSDRDRVRAGSLAGSPGDLITFEVPIRAKPKNSRKAWRGRIIEDPKFRAWEIGFAAAIARFKPREPLTGPIALDIMVVRRRPLRAKVKLSDGLTWYAARPDLDNLRKGISDTLQRCGFFRDDSQIVLSASMKCYAEKGGEERIRIRIQSLQDTDPAACLWMFYMPDEGKPE